MDRFFDQAARILASATSRRQTLKLLGSVLVGGILGAVYPRRAAAQQTGAAKVACGDKKCPDDKVCCTTGSKPFCITEGKTCCGDKACGKKKICCTTGLAPFCATEGKTCCGDKACNKHHSCEDGRCAASKG